VCLCGEANVFFLCDMALQKSNDVTTMAKVEFSSSHVGTHDCRKCNILFEFVWPLKVVSLDM